MTRAGGALGTATTGAHGEHAAGATWLDGDTLLALAALGLVAWLYVVMALRQHTGTRGWTPWRTASFLGGVALVAAAVVPGAAPLPPGSFTEHMYQHVVVGMYAPLLLVLGAPVTLLLRSVPPRAGRRVVRVLRSPPARVLTHPVATLALTGGTLYALYLTPLYTATAHDPALHHVLHVHLLLAGYLFAASIAGPDPAPHRPGVPARLVVLGVAITAHAVLAQLLYAGIVHVPTSDADRRTGADLMYYAGDTAELLLALALVATWRPRRER